jgi:hypothetical protein
MAWEFCHIAALERFSCRPSEKFDFKIPLPPLAKGEPEGKEPIDFVANRILCRVL